MGRIPLTSLVSFWEPGICFFVPGRRPRRPVLPTGFCHGMNLFECFSGRRGRRPRTRAGGEENFTLLPRAFLISPGFINCINYFNYICFHYNLNPMKNFLRISFIIIISCANLHAQEGMNWYIGNSIGLNFQCAPPYEYSVLSNTQVDNRGGNGSTVMTDTNGRLLFLSNGRSVYNRNGKAMPHGWHIFFPSESLAEDSEVFASANPFLLLY